MRVVVTSGLRKECGITYFARRLRGALPCKAVTEKPVNALGADRVVINFEHGVMSRRTALKLANNAERAVAILHTIRRDEDRRFIDEIRDKAYTIAMHPYANDYVDDIALHPGYYYDELDTVVPERVDSLGVFGLIRPGKGIEAAIKLAAELGLDVYLRGEAQDPDLVRSLMEFATTVGVSLNVEDKPWSPTVVRNAVENGVLPVIPSIASSFRTIWASGTEADLIGVRVPYVSYPALGGHNPCAYAIELGGPSYVTMFTEGVEAAAERAAKFVDRIRPVDWRDFAAVVAQAL